MITTALGVAPQAIAMPGPIRLNGGTLQALGFPDAGQWDLTRPKPATDTGWQTFRSASKLHMLPAEWHERTGTPLVSTAAVAIIVFPWIVQNSDEFRLRRTDPELAGELLAAQCMSPGDDVYVHDWLGIRTISADDLVGNRARVLDALAGWPALSLTFGTHTPYSTVTETLRTALHDLALRP